MLAILGNFWAIWHSSNYLNTVTTVTTLYITSSNSWCDSPITSDVVVSVDVASAVVVQVVVLGTTGDAAHTGETGTIWGVCIWV